jgi:hypothetical protein
MEAHMSSAVKLSAEIIADAKIVSKALNRSIAGQIEHWSKIGKIAEENPDLTYEHIKGILLSLEDVAAGNVEPYEFKK